MCALAFAMGAQGCVLSEQRAIRSQRSETINERVEAGADASIDARADALVDARVDAQQPSRAGLACDGDGGCGELLCDRSVRGGTCTGPCTNNGVLVSEQQQCGGAGATCLSFGDAPDARSQCTSACRPSRAGSCRSGFICTGYWYTHEGATPDTPGCAPFCTSDAHCPEGERCNARTGACSATGSDETRIADGLPCVVPAAGEPSPCRGLCFDTSLSRSGLGLCGSLVDLSARPTCGDPALSEPIGRLGADNLGICLFRRCDATRCCPSGLRCFVAFAGDSEGSCDRDHGEPMQPSIACDAADAGDAGEDSAADATSDGEGGL